MRDHLPPGLPPDPFADDPCDPSAALDAVEPGQPLDQQERVAVEADLADLAVYEALLAHKGIRGLVVCCDECQQDHYHDWDMLRANLLQLLIDGTVRPHDPPTIPNPMRTSPGITAGATPTPRSMRRRQTPTGFTGVTDPSV